MRGALETYQLIQCVLGIIPADAGSTRTGFQGLPFSEDHPRGCGEHHAESRMFPIDPGSSPRMRGALLQGFKMMLAMRIIPADAGSTIARG